MLNFYYSIFIDTRTGIAIVIKEAYVRKLKDLCMNSALEDSKRCLTKEGNRGRVFFCLVCVQGNEALTTEKSLKEDQIRLRFGREIFTFDYYFIDDYFKIMDIRYSVAEKIDDLDLW